MKPAKRGHLGDLAKYLSKIDRPVSSLQRDSLTEPDTLGT
jgi:hypothetical protein